MKIFKSDIFGECPQPETFDELTQIIFSQSAFDSEKYLNPKIWRGQSDISWRIDSSGFRRILIGSKIYKDHNRDLRSYEKHLLRHATHQGFRFQNGRVLSDFELLAKLQHHGAATRLVDFSRSAFVGLWFGCIENLNTTGILIGIHSHFIGGTESMPRNETYDEIIDDCEKHNNPMVYESPSVSPRIASQHAQFLYSGVSNDPRGSLHLATNDDANLCIALSPTLKTVCIEILESIFDYRTKTLFPDLDGFGMANRFNLEPNKMDRW